MTRSRLLPPVLVAASILMAAPVFAGSINSVNNGMPNRISMNCTTPKGKLVTDPATCASEGCVDAQGKPVADASACAAPASTTGPAAEPAPADGKITKSRSNIQNN